MNKSDICLNCMETKGTAKQCPYCGVSEDDALESGLHLHPGTILQGKYLIGRALGQGGFGITYLAWDLNLNLKLAIKEYMPLDLAYRTAGQADVSVYKKSLAENFCFGMEKYLEEAQTLAKFNDNPNTVNVSDFFKGNGTAYMVMNYIDGITLKAYLAKKNEPLIFEKAIEIFMPVLDALKEVHKAGLLHRDISPDNILITKNSRVVLIDFGAARQAVGDKSQTLSVILKLGFSPEEQYHSRGVQGPWTDIYAVAASIYYTITGQAPPESLSRLSEDTLVPPSQEGANINTTQESVLLKALSVKPKDRYQEIKDLQDALLGTIANPGIDTNSSKNNIRLNVLPVISLPDQEVKGDHKEPAKEESLSSDMPADNEQQFVMKEAAKKEPSSKIKFENNNNHNGIYFLIGIVLVVSIILYGAFRGLAVEHATIEYLDGTYIGDIRYDKPHGQGSWENSEGLSYVGEWKNGMPHGQGTYSTSDGSVFTGELKDAMPYKGTLMSSDGAVFEGEVNGHGVHTWSDGRKYVGEHKEAVGHGFGVYTWPDGSKYEGEHKEGMRHGQGTYTSSDGIVEEGIWEYDEYIGTDF